MFMNADEEKEEQEQEEQLLQQQRFGCVKNARHVCTSAATTFPYWLYCSKVRLCSLKK